MCDEKESMMWNDMFAMGIDRSPVFLTIRHDMFVLL
jgi:hypothetical protein